MVDGQWCMLNALNGLNDAAEEMEEAEPLVGVADGNVHPAEPGCGSRQLG